MKLYPNMKTELHANGVAVANSYDSPDNADSKGVGEHPVIGMTNYTG